MHPICEWKTCERPARRKNGGLCGAHWQRQRAGRDMNPPLRKVQRRADLPEICTHSQCDVAHYARGLCRFHYMRQYNGLDLDSPRLWNPREPGRSKTKNAYGYVLLWMPEHPAAFGKGFIFEHRYVMEQAIGRYVMRGETVHHLNGVRDDNRLENLELWASVHPTGQRVEDLAEMARKILSCYGSPLERGQYGPYPEDEIQAIIGRSQKRPRG